MARAAVGAIQSLENTIEGCTHFVDENITVKTLSPQKGTGKNVSITLYASTAVGTVLGSSAIWSDKDAVRIALGDEMKTSRMAATDELWQRSVELVGDTTAKKLCSNLQNGVVVDRYSEKSQ